MNSLTTRRISLAAFTACLAVLTPTAGATFEAHVAASTIDSQSPLPAPLEDDGPYLTLEPDGSVMARWVRDAEVKEQHFAPGETIDLPEFADLLGSGFDPSVVPEPIPALWPQPKKLLAISDVEGSYDDALRFLRANGVIDERGAWTFGEAHLVCVGDFVDRGTQVTETLWLFHRLAREAAASGGVVHFLLGNHEAMVLGGDVRYTPDKYKNLAAAMGLRTEELLGKNTVLGRWLRSCNSIIRVGETVFVHAGLSPAIAGESLDYDAINDGIRSVAGQRRKEIEDVALAELAWGRSGPLWYRGYFAQHAESYGPVPTIAELDQVLKSAGAARVVVGHTKVKKVTAMFEGRIIAMDIPWTRPNRVRGLLFENDQIGTVSIKGEREPFLLPLAAK